MLSVLLDHLDKLIRTYLSERMLDKRGSCLVLMSGLFCFFLQDKTFGLKNKKGAKQQKFIKTVVHQVKSGPTGLKVSTGSVG